MVALKKVRAIIYRSAQGSEPVREFLRGLSREDRRVVGNDIATIEYGWPVGKPTCAPLGAGLWEVRSSLTGNRMSACCSPCIKATWFCCTDFIKKTQKAPPAEVAVARKRLKEVTQ